MSSLRLITFDLDDTLWDVAPVMNNAEALLREWLASNAARLGPVPIEHLWAIRTRLLFPAGVVAGGWLAALAATNLGG